MGLQSEVLRFKSWESISTPAIVGVKDGPESRYFHWVVWIPQSQSGVLIDPENGVLLWNPTEELLRDYEYEARRGNYIEVPELRFKCISFDSK